VETGDLTQQEFRNQEGGPGSQELPYRATFHPLGFTVHVASNSHEVLQAAAESWGMWAAEFALDPVELQIVVQEEGDLALEPEFRTRGHLFSVVADRHNYAVMDLDRLFGCAFVSQRTVSDHAWFRWHFLDAMGLFLLAQKHAMALHAACVARNGAGILLAGASCAGKSTLAWACARAGWTFLGDDATWALMEGPGRKVFGRPHLVRFRHDAPRLFPELEGFLARVRPNGKLSIEVPTSTFPHIRTASRCEAAAVVFLDRSGRRRSGFERVASGTAAAALLGELEMHREQVRQRYRGVVRRILEAPAFRLRYKSLEEGIALLGELHAGLRA